MARAGDQLFNPLTGERIVFRVTACETGGALLEMDAFWAGAARRAVEHVHPEMQERWEVIAGHARFRIDGVQRTAGPGEVVVAAPGSAHEAWNPAAEPAHVRIQMRPALDWERFVERLFAISGAAHEAGQPAPEAKLLRELMRRFRREIRLASTGDAPAPSDAA
jgi:mannose-6-phosphate isomerase-like protein (cupin superfamily)